MVVLDNPALEHISLVRFQEPRDGAAFPGVPVVDLSLPDSESLIVRACEEFGFFKVVNHGVPFETAASLEAEALRFFSKPLAEKEKGGGPHASLGYGNKNIGANGDVGWVEYLLMQIAAVKAPCSAPQQPAAAAAAADHFLTLLGDYTAEVKRLTLEILEKMAEGLRVEQKDVFSRLVRDEESDSVLRLNHYPPCPPQGVAGCSLTGFGEHTDPQIITVLRSNNTAGLQISLKDGSWVSVPPDQTSFFINVGDSLQVLTNGKFRSVRHRVLASGRKSRVSMVYFGGPPGGERIAPLPLLMGSGEESRYREFTWLEYKKSAYRTRLADDRLKQFEKRSGDPRRAVSLKLE